MGAATLIIFAVRDAPLRLGLGDPGVQDWLLGLNFGWAQELCIIMFVWMAKFGAAYGVRTGIHVGVDVLINRMDANRGKFVVFGLLAGATVHRHRRHPGRHLRLGERGALRSLTTSYLAWDTGDLPEGPTTPDLEWPTWIVYSASRSAPT
jgi:C4-dicarboxylate transporter DctQ subunit